MSTDRIAEQTNFNSQGRDRNQPDMCSPHNRINIRPPKARLSAGVLFALIGSCISCALPSALFSQTAHFSGAIRTLASGLNLPNGVTVDAKGNVFFADSSNNAIKEVLAVNGFIPANPTIEVLGSGFNLPTGVAVDSSGNVYVADDFNNALKEILAVNGSIPPSPTINTLEAVNSAYSVALSGPGALFFVDLEDSEVSRYMKAGRIVVNVPVGSGYEGPRGIAADNNSNVFVADSGHNAVEEVFASGGYTTISTLGSGFNFPTAVAVDANGNVFVADFGNNLVKEIIAVNGSIPANPTINVIGTQFLQPEGIAIDGTGNVYVSDTGHNAVREIVAGGNFGPENVGSTNSVVLPIFFTFDTAGTASAAKVLTRGAAGLDFTDAGTGSCEGDTTYSAGDVCTVDVRFTPTAPGPRYGAVELIDGSGNLLATGYVQGTGVGPRVNVMPGQQSTKGGTFVKPYGAAVDGGGNVYATDYGNNAVGEIERVLGHIVFVPFASGFSSPAGLAMDGSGNLFVADHGSSAVKEILAQGGYSTVKTVGGSFNGPLGVAVDGSGNVFVADSGNGAVKEILFAGGYTRTLTLGSGFSEPAGVAVDGSGNVFVADYLQNAVKEILAVDGSIPANPTINTLGSGFSGPSDVAVDVDGNVLVADTGNNAVKEIVAVNGSIPSSPTINTLGSGFANPAGLAVEAHGNVFVADSNNQRIEELDYADPPSLQFASTNVGSISSDSPQSVTVVNQGNAPLSAAAPGLSVPADFKLVPGSGTPSDCTATFSLASGQGCNLSIEFAPTTGGNPLTESLVITDNSLNAGPPGYPTQSILLSGVGLAPTVSLSATSLLFGSEEIGVASGSKSVTLTNTGDGTLAISSIAVTGADASSFVFANSCGTTLAAGASCSIHGHFAPVASGAMTAAIVITDNATGSTQSIALSGTGAGPAVKLSATHLAFGVENVGTAGGSQSVTMTNTGSATLTISSITVTGADASSWVFANACGTSLAAGANCSIHGHFAPVTGGALTAQISITDNAAGSPQTIALSGTGTGPAVKLSATSLSFGSEKVGSASASQSVTVTNTGNQALSITSIAITGTNASSFVFANTCGTTIPAGANCTIHGHFAPTITGALTATVTITDNAGGSPQTIALSGTGQ